MNPFTKRKQELVNLRALKPKYQKKSTNADFDEHLFFRCKKCGHQMTQAQFEFAGYVCGKCKEYYSVTAPQRLSMILDKNSFTEMDCALKTINHLDFPEYSEKLDALQKKTGLNDCVQTGFGTIEGIKIAIGVMDTRFLMGSMGTVAGERITRLTEYATAQRLPLILVCASGGARMQEGILSLMQMVKTSASVKRHSNQGLLYISVLTHPTTGGVTASFASLADIILAETKALIGFAGPRVIESTMKQKLPKGFQSAEYLQENGFVDKVVERQEIRVTLSQLLQIHHGRKENL